MNRKHRWLWGILFTSVAILLSALATGWNVVLMRDYQHILQLAKSLSSSNELSYFPSHLIVKMILGTLGFVATLTLTILIFIKLLKEMRLNQQQSEFLATVSHELKTPIAAMELSSSLLRTSGLSHSETQRLWSSHQVELNRLKEEVDALLEAARWQVKPKLYPMAPFLLEEGIQESMERWKWRQTSSRRTAPKLSRAAAPAAQQLGGSTPERLVRPLHRSPCHARGILRH